MCLVTVELNAPTINSVVELKKAPEKGAFQAVVGSQAASLRRQMLQAGAAGL